MLQTANIPPPEEDCVARTPADLRAMRMLLGLSQEQVVKIIGVSHGEVRTLEKGRTHFIYRGHAAILEGMVTQVNALLEANLGDDAAAPEFLFVYPNDDVFLEMEPRLAWMRHASVHQMYAARLMDEWVMRGHRPAIVEIVPHQYQEEWLNGRPDTLENRNTWARAHMQVIKMREGLPGDMRERERRS
jgi:transcriptional regulator with XRE-family HTH domain